MPKQKSDEPSFEISLSDFLSSHLREDHSQPISPKLGEVIEAISTGLCICHVQWTTFEGKRMASPMLWRYKYWVDSCEHYASLKKRAEEERVRHHILDANIKLVSKALQRQHSMDEGRATDAAISILVNNYVGAIRLLQVKLITKESEL